MLGPDLFSPAIILMPKFAAKLDCHIKNFRRDLVVPACAVCLSELGEVQVAKLWAPHIDAPRAFPYFGASSTIENGERIF